MSLKVSIIQADLYWENVDQNLSLFTQKFEGIIEKTDIIVLPEMFNTGFSMKSEKLAEKMDGKTVGWMKNQAKKYNAVITGSLIIETFSKSSEGEERKRSLFYNRLIWAQPDGKILSYDKRHLFRMAGEDNHFNAGENRLIITYKGWRICPLICYDLRFPVWSRNSSFSTMQSSPVYDLLIYIANWPTARKQPWSKLLDARAIENQCYVIGLNRVGTDGKGISYSGNSAVINPKGETISTLSENEEGSETIHLSLDDLNDFRTKFPVSLDGDEFTL